MRQFDVQRCVDIHPAQMVSTGIAFELVHWRLPSGALMVLEDIPTIFDDVTAYDQGGTPYHSFGSINGERLCRNELVHPDPAVTQPLTWEFALTWTDDPSRNAPSISETTGGSLAMPPRSIRRSPSPCSSSMVVEAAASQRRSRNRS